MNVACIFLGTLSSKPTLLRLISFINESDGRYVHNLELKSLLIIITNYYQIQFHN